MLSRKLCYNNSIFVFRRNYFAPILYCKALYIGVYRKFLKNNSKINVIAFTVCRQQLALNCNRFSTVFSMTFVRCDINNIIRVIISRVITRRKRPRNGGKREVIFNYSKLTCSRACIVVQVHYYMYGYTYKI